MKHIVFDKKNVYPTKIVCVGRNYVEHIKELNNKVPKKLVIFNKPNSAISSDFYFFKSCRFESEISFIIKDNKIAGIGFGFDLTKVNLQEEAKKDGLPWERAKAFDNSAVFSEFVSVDDIGNLSMKVYQNNELVQFGDIDLMINKPDFILQEIKTFMSLEDFDIIMSGTPKGVGSYKVGDLFLAQIFDGNNLLIEKEWKVINKES